MSRYQPEFEDRFVYRRRRYRSLRKQIQRHVDQILDDSYTGTERLGRIPGKLDLRGSRGVVHVEQWNVCIVKACWCGKR